MRVDTLKLLTLTSGIGCMEDGEVSLDDMLLLAGQLTGGDEPVSAFVLGAVTTRILQRVAYACGEWPTSVEVKQALDCGPAVFAAYLKGIVATLGPTIDLSPENYRG